MSSGGLNETLLPLACTTTQPTPVHVEPTHEISTPAISVSAGVPPDLSMYRSYFFPSGVFFATTDPKKTSAL